MSLLLWLVRHEHLTHSRAIGAQPALFELAAKIRGVLARHVSSKACGDKVDLDLCLIYRHSALHRA